MEHELFLRSFMMVVPPQHVAASFTQAMTDVHFAEGDHLYEQGEASHTIYFIVTGQVNLEATGQEPWAFEDNAVVGILDALLDRPRARTAVAVTDLHAVAMAVEDWFDIYEEDFGFACQTMVNVTKNLHEMMLSLAPDGVFRLEEDCAGCSDRAPSGVCDRCVMRRRTERKLDRIEKIMVLRRSPVFARASAQAQAVLAQLAKEESWSAGATISREGDPIEDIRIVVNGCVRATRSHPTVEAYFRPGALIEEQAVLGYETHQYTVEAVDQVKTLRIQMEDLFDVMEDHMGVTRSIYAHSAVERERVMSALAKQSRSLKEAL